MIIILNMLLNLLRKLFLYLNLKSKFKFIKLHFFNRVNDKFIIIT